MNVIHINSIGFYSLSCQFMHSHRDGIVYKAIVVSLFPNPIMMDFKLTVMQDSLQYCRHPSQIMFWFVACFVASLFNVFICFFQASLCVYLHFVKGTTNNLRMNYELTAIPSI